MRCGASVERCVEREQCRSDGPNVVMFRVFVAKTSIFLFTLLARPRRSSGRLTLDLRPPYGRPATSSSSIFCMMHFLSAKRNSGPPPANIAPASALSLSLADCSQGKRVAVLGGSFDPITTGHLKVACEIIHARKADEVWIVPCGVRPDKPSLKTPYMHRLLMCHLAVNTTFGSSFPIRVCDIEGAEKSALATYHLMQRLRNEYPTKTFLFVIGADLLETLKTWEAPGVPNAGQRLWNECDFLLMERPGYEIPSDLPSNFTLLTGALKEETSSSEIRRTRALMHRSQL